MVHTDDGDELEPLLQPRVIRMLKNRDRLINLGVREEILEEMEETIARRRTTDTIAHRVSTTMADVLRNSGEPVVRNRMESRLERMNSGVLNRL